MITRRQWIVGSSGTLGLSLLPAVASWAAHANVSPGAGSPGGTGGLAIELTGMRDGVAPALHHCLVASGCPVSDSSPSMNIQWSPLAHGWHQDSLRVHARYVPEAAVNLDGIAGLPPASSRELRSGDAVEGDRMAVALGTEHFAVLVNRGKAGRAGLAGTATPTLDAFERSGLRARFLLSSWSGVGDSGWVFPLVAHHLDMRPGRHEADDLLLSDAGLGGLARLHDDVIRRLDIVKEPSPWNDAQYDALIDPTQGDVAAVYGNPVRLQRVLAAAGQHVDVDVVPLGDFLGLPVADLPRIQVLQCGTGVKDLAFAKAAMAPVVAALDGLSMQGGFSDCIGARCVPVTSSSLAMKAIDPGTDRYLAIPRLELWTDRAFGVRLVDTLVRAARNHRSGEAALIAASQAFHALSAYERASSTVASA